MPSNRLGGSSDGVRRASVAAAVLAVLLLSAWLALPTSGAGFSGSHARPLPYQAAASFGTHAEWVLADGATGYWRLNERVVGEDRSATAAHASTSGGLTAQVTGALGGTANSALRFGGTGAVTAPASTTFTYPATQPFTVEAWVRPTLVDGDYRSIAQCNNGESVNTKDGWFLWQQGTSGVGFERFNGSNRDAFSVGTAMTSGTWVHVAASYDGATMRLYLGGTQVGTVASSRSITNRACTLRIGEWPGYAAGYWVGDLDEVAVYPTALSASRIGAHYAARTNSVTYQATVVADNPVGYWPLEGTLTAADSSPSAAHAAYSGGVTAPVTGGLSDTPDTAARFTGTGRANRAADTRYAFAGTSPFSIEAWVRPTTVDTGFRMIAYCDNSSISNRNGWYLWQHQTYGLGTERFQNHAADLAHDNAALPVGAWTHVVATFDGTQLRIYRNGQLVAQQTSAKVLPNQPCTLNIGGWPGVTDGWWYGDLDEIAVYPTALTPLQVTLHYWRRG